MDEHDYKNARDRSEIKRGTMAAYLLFSDIV